MDENNGSKESSKESKSSLDVMLEESKEFMESLQTLKNPSPSLTWELITDRSKADEMLDSLIGLQGLYGKIFSLDPESTYTPQFKNTSETFENIRKIAIDTSNLIDESFTVWQNILDNVHPFTRTVMYCHKLFTKRFTDTRFSFCGIIIQILSNCRKIISFLDNLEEGELIKAGLASVRSRRLGEELGKEYGKPPSVTEKEKVESS